MAIFQKWISQLIECLSINTRVDHVSEKVTYEGWEWSWNIDS